MEIRVHIIPKAFYYWCVWFKTLTIIIAASLVRNGVLSIKNPCMFRDLKALLHILVFTFQFLGLMIAIWGEGWISERESSNFLLVCQKKSICYCRAVGAWIMTQSEVQRYFSPTYPKSLVSVRTLAGSHLRNKWFSEEWRNNDSLAQWCLFLYLPSLVMIQPFFAEFFFFFFNLDILSWS